MERVAKFKYKIDGLSKNKAIKRERKKPLLMIMMKCSHGKFDIQEHGDIIFSVCKDCGKVL